MKSVKKLLMLCVCMCLIAGCGKDTTVRKERDAGKETESEAKAYNNAPEETAAAERETASGTVDFDFTDMSSDMIYATVYQMLAAPDQYVGKTFRMDGSFYVTYYEPTQTYNYYCIIWDAMACCAQGMEFVWDDGSHVYPDEYPSENASIVVEGTFETYRDDRDGNLYGRLANATLKVKK